MRSLGALAVAAGATVAAGYWVIYQLLVQLGGVLKRLDNIEMHVAGLNFPAGLWADHVRKARSLRVGNQFEADNILDAVAVRDEYRISGQRFDAADVVIDVGAHIGVFSYLCYQQGSRAVHAYEPSERNFELLKKNLGSLPGAHCVRAAVWRSDRQDTTQLRLSGPAGENTGARSVLVGGDGVDFENQKLLAGGGSSDSADVVSLDSILERFERVKLLKLDCEGSEFPILLTSSRLDRVERIVGELHECDEEIMRRLVPEAHVPGYPVFRAAGLVQRLESCGFRVNLRAGSENMYLFDAHRSNS